MLCYIFKLLWLASTFDFEDFFFKQKYIINRMQDSTQFYSFNQKREKEAEKYKKIAVLGQGSMGKAYLVESGQDLKQYVMKRINIGHLNEKQKQNALRQAHLHSLFTHPNIIQLKQVYQTTGEKLCIIMEYAQGGDLQQFMQAQNGKLLPETTILNLFIQLCLGLQEVHAKRIIHRDIKTANIFLNKNYEIKIGDFGISKSLDQSMMAATAMIGTPYYLSPEMVEGKPYSTKADIWALGVILYQLCSLRLPFEANSIPVLALKIMKGSFPPVPNQFSKDIKALILQMLQVDQKKRPSIDVILQKPFIFNLLAKQQKVRQNDKKQQKKQQMKEKQKKIEQKRDKIALQQKEHKHKQIQQKQRMKKQLAEKRQQERRKMRQDIRKKRNQKEYDGQKLPTNYTSEPPNSRFQTKKSPQKSPKKDITKPVKNVVSSKQTKSQEQHQPIKPWLLKKPIQKKQVTVQIFIPEMKPRQSSKQDPIVDFKMQIYEGKKPDSKSTQFMKGQIKQQGRKSMPLIDLVQNYHFNESKRQQLQRQSIYSEQQYQPSEDSNNDFSQILNNIKHLNELTKNLPDPSRSVCLYEQSQNFDSTVQVKAPPRPEQIENLLDLLNSQSLQELRMLLEQKLGQSKFISAYTIVKQHLDSYYQIIGQKSNEIQKQNVKQRYVFNKKLLREKLDFLKEDQFETNIQLLYTLLMYEDLEMQKNQKHENGPQLSKYQRLI